MANFSKLQLSGSVNGKAIIVTSPGTFTIHTASVVPGVLDELWLWAVNFGGATPTLSLFQDAAQFSRIGTPVNLEPIFPGIPISNGVVITATTQAGMTWGIFGYVNRITP